MSMYSSIWLFSVALNCLLEDKLLCKSGFVSLHKISSCALLLQIGASCTGAYFHTSCVTVGPGSLASFWSIFSGESNSPPKDNHSKSSSSSDSPWLFDSTMPSRTMPSRVKRTAKAEPSMPSRGITKVTWEWQVQPNGTEVLCKVIKIVFSSWAMLIALWGMPTAQCSIL